MLNMLEHEEKFKHLSRRLGSFNGSRAFGVHLSGMDKSLSLVSLNTCNATVTCINHDLKTIILGYPSELSIANLDNGYSVVLFRHPAMLTAMLVNKKGYGEPACTSYANEAKAPFHNIDKEDYKIFTATAFDIKKAGKELKLSVYNALKHRLDMSSNSFKLFLDNDEVESFINLVNTFKEEL